MKDTIKIKLQKQVNEWNEHQEVQNYNIEMQLNIIVKQILEELVETYKKMKWGDTSNDMVNFDEVNTVANYTHNVTLDNVLQHLQEQIKSLNI